MLHVCICMPTRLLAFARILSAAVFKSSNPCRVGAQVVLAGESKLVQDLAAWNPPNLLDLTQYYHPRARRNTLAHLAGDQSPIGAARLVLCPMMSAVARRTWEEG